MYIVVCERCGAEIVGYDERDARLQASLHICRHDISELPFDLLHQVVYRELSETIAWKLAAERM